MNEQRARATTNKAFLQKIVDDIVIDGTDAKGLKNHCFVFPTRRAGVYFKRYLTERFEGRYIWAPRIFSIVEFTEFLTDQALLDGVTMVLELYKIYHRYEPEVKFDKFYPWGQLIVKDFDEIDKYLVDAEQLFTNLKDLKVMEESFALEEEELGFLRLFWRVFEKEETGDIEEEFIRIWQILGKVYHEFRASLQANNVAYDGMLQREIVEGLRKGELDIPFDKIVFAGFNALTKSEEGIIAYLTNNHPQKIKVYWDTDVYYMRGSQQEAGKFTRIYKEKWQSKVHDWTSQTNLRMAAKKIQMIGVPLKVGQAKFTGQLLQTLLRTGEISPRDTAIVLGDESLLFPMLYALPNNVKNVNITMGYPLKNSPLYQLLETVVQLQKTAITMEVKDKINETGEEQDRKKQQKTAGGKTKTKIAFYSKFILQILNNPFIKSFAKEDIEKYVAYIARNNLMYIYEHTIKERLKHKIFTLIFRENTNFLQLIETFNNLLVLLFHQIKEENGIKEEDINDKPDEVVGVEETQKTTVEEEEKIPEKGKKKAVELEFIYHLLKQLKKLEETLHKYRQEVNLDTFWKLFREIIQSVKLPFTGEPLRGLQIMGFLETRTLDFKNLFVLGMNEGIIPSAQQMNTFVPFHLRRAFGMPTFLEQDAIFAYHFYHLLQRTENIFLLYNTEVGSLGGGEKSRFLLQIEHELAQLPNGKIQVENQLVSTPLVVDSPIKDLLEIPKNEAIMEELHRYLSNYPQPENRKVRKLSPSAMSLYITCPVQFYFKYIAKLYEIEAVDEDISPMILGNILHRTIELIYVELLFNKLLDKDMINLKTIKSAIFYPYTVNMELENMYKDEDVSLDELKKRHIAQDVKSWLISKISERYHRHFKLGKTALNAVKTEGKALELKINQYFEELEMPDYGEYKETMLKKTRVWIIHKILEQKTPDTAITEEDIKKILKDERRIERKLKQAFEEERFRHHKEGKNLLLKKIIKRLVVKILQNDLNDAPFHIVGLEASEYAVDLDIGEDRLVRVSGIIDRVDSVTLEDGKVAFRILDYKTGKVELNKPVRSKKMLSFEAYLSKYFEDSDFKAGFQAYLYSYLFWRKNKKDNPNMRILAGIYALKEINKGVRYCRKKEALSDEFFECFEEKLKAMLIELFDKNHPFIQTDKEKKYDYSPYKGLVGKS